MADLNANISVLTDIKKQIFSLRNVYDEFKDQEIRKPLKSVIKISDEIYKTAMADLDKVEKLGRFSTYYLPALNSILRKYLVLTAGSTSLDDEAAESRNKVIAFLKNTHFAFTEIHRSLFTDNAVDLNADIQIMENELKQP